MIDSYKREQELKWFWVVKWERREGTANEVEGMREESNFRTKDWAWESLRKERR